MKKRRVWKTFYITSGDDFNSLASLWQSSIEDWGRYTMDFQNGIGMIETNLPLRELRIMFRFLDIKMPDYVSDTEKLADDK